MMTPPMRASTTTGWPSLAESPSAINLDERSLPPAAPAVSSRIGRAGYCGGDAASAEKLMSTNVMIRASNTMHAFLIVIPDPHDYRHPGPAQAEVIRDLRSPHELVVL